MSISALSGVRGKVFLTLIVLLVAAVVGWRLYENRKISYEFAGNVESVEGNVIVLYGQFVLNTGESAEGEGRRVEVTVPPGVAITREGLHIPDQGVYNPNNLPKEISNVGPDQVAADAAQATVGMRVKAGKNIFGKAAFEATEVSYRTALYASQKP